MPTSSGRARQLRAARRLGATCVGSASGSCESGSGKCGARLYLSANKSAYRTDAAWSLNSFRKIQLCVVIFENVIQFLVACTGTVPVYMSTIPVLTASTLNTRMVDYNESKEEKKSEACANY